MKCENEQKRSLPNPVLLIGIVALIAVMLVVVLWENTEDPADLAAQSGETTKIQTTYVTLTYPEEYGAYLKHSEMIDGVDATEVFSMVYDDVEAELFRLSFTAAEPELVEGYLNTENGLLYVSLQPATGGLATVYSYDQTEGEEVYQEMESIYYAMMGTMGDVLSSLQESDQFSVAREVAESDRQTVEILYWQISLPNAISWEISSEGETQTVTFWGTVAEKQVALYTLTLGGDEAENTVGQYETEAGRKNVTLEVCGLEEQGIETEEERAMAHVLMETVNDVLQVISNDKNFYSQLAVAE